MWIPSPFIALSFTMGGERVATTRQRMSGKICTRCHRLLDWMPWHKPGERYCERCEPRMRVYMKFVRWDDLWRVSFMSADLRTTYPRRFTFSQDFKIMEMAEKGGASMQLDDRQALEMGLKAGQGAVWLNLTTAQLAKLR